MRIAITGSNGFIGSELVSYFIAQEHKVLLLQRKKPEVIPTSATFARYDLNTPDTLPDITGVDALIHTAYMPFTSSNGASDKNIKGTLALYNLCLSNGVQFVFLSSMSAHANAVSQYGKHKFALEQQLNATRCLVLKPGLVIGKKGLFSRIYQQFKKMPFAVLVGGGKQPVQPVYIGDLIQVIDTCIQNKRSGKYTIATSRVYTMRELFSAIAGKAGKRPIFIPLPYALVSLGIGVIEVLHLPFAVTRENLDGLRQLEATDTSADLAKLGVTLLDLKDSLDLIAEI